MQVRLKKAKETKNTFKYEEIPASEYGTILGSIYLQKWFVSSRLSDDDEIIIEIKEKEE